MGLAGFEAGAETGEKITLAKRADICSGKLPTGAGHRRRIQTRVGFDGLALGRPQHARRFVQFLFCEEAGLALAHGQRRSAVDGAVIVEEEQAHLTLARVTVHVDVVAKRLARPRQAAVVGQLAAQQAVTALSLVQAVDAQIRYEEEVGLARLDHDPRGHEPAVEKPRILAHVRLGPHRAQAHRPGRRVQAHHPIGKQQGRLGHAHLDRMLVLRLELRTEEIRDAARGVGFQIAA